MSDWAGAADVNSESPFEGALEFAARDVLTAIAAEKAIKNVPWHDLEMIVKAFYWSQHPTVVFTLIESKVDLNRSEGLLACAQLWEDLLKAPVWRELLEAARRGNHDGMIELINESFPWPEVRT